VHSQCVASFILAALSVCGFFRLSCTLSMWPVSCQLHSQCVASFVSAALSVCGVFDFSCTLSVWRLSSQLHSQYVASSFSAAFSVCGLFHFGCILSMWLLSFFTPSCVLGLCLETRSTLLSGISHKGIAPYFQVVQSYQLQASLEAWRDFSEFLSLLKLN